MGIQKIASNVAQSLTSAFKKGEAISIQALKKPVAGGAQKLTSALDCLASSKKAFVKAQENLKASEFVVDSAVFVKKATPSQINTSPKTMRGFAREAVLNGATAKEAVNGAKEMMHVMTKPVGFTAAESAKTFIEAGPGQLERKLDLQEKYGKKLLHQKMEKAKADAFLQELNKVDELLTKLKK